MVEFRSCDREVASGTNPTYEEKEKDPVEEISLQRLGHGFSSKDFNSHAGSNESYLLLMLPTSSPPPQSWKKAFDLSIVFLF